MQKKKNTEITIRSSTAKYLTYVAATGDAQESYGPVNSDRIQTVFLSDTQTVTSIKVSEGDTLALTGVYAGMESGEITLKNETTGAIIPLTCSFTDRQAAILKAGSLLSYTKQLGE